MRENLSIRLGGQERSLPRGSTLQALLESLDCAPASVATAVNGRFVPRNERGAWQLRDGDVVLLFQPIVGG